METTKTELTPGARQLLEQLREGNNIAEPRNYLASAGYVNLARATINNAVALCSTNSCDDFRIFSALYAVRHGLELWLKALVIDVEIDRILDGVTQGKTYEELQTIVREDRTENERKAAKSGLMRSLCQFRNLASGLRYPEFREREIAHQFCDEGIAELRAATKKWRSRFVSAWAVPVAGHRLVPLWARGRERFSEATYRARDENQEGIGGELLEEEEVSAACELFGALDPLGDAFRYPSSLSGGGLHRTQSISLEALGKFASRLDDTVNAYGCALDEGYSNSTVGCPGPALW